MSHPVILIFVGCYLPGYKSGGPVRTIANMVKALGDEFEFRIVTSDRDMLDDQPYENVSVNQWNRVGKALVYYASPDIYRFSNWKKLIYNTPYDVLYLNSLFSPSFTLLPLLIQRLDKGSTKPLVIAPRGELSPGALTLKGWKKKPFIHMAIALGFYKHALWHASTEKELQLIRQQFGQNSKSLVACNLPAPINPPTQWSIRRNSDKPLRVLFLSRIARMKNLDFALRVFKQCNINVQFDIWGTLEDNAYWLDCKKIIASMPQNISVNYHGEAEHTQVPTIMANYDLLFLPTRGENYGHVIAEALSAGTPTLLSDQTPWRKLYEKGVGWDLSLEGNEQGFVKAIENANKRVKNEGSRWRQHVYEYAVKELSDPTIVEANRSLFYQAINGVREN